MGLKKNKSAITHLEIAFREIDRFFDVHGTVDPRFASRIPAIGADGVPRIVVRDPFKIWASEPVSLTDENGDPIQQRMKELTGVYRTIRTYGEGAFIRTFARQRSKPIHGKYVYIWAADDKKGSGMRLVRELYFTQGQFRLVDFKSKQRRPKGQARSRLVLDLLSFQDADPKQVFYFFLLARYQVPRKRLDAIMQDVPARGMRLWDEFYTDYCPEGDLSKPRIVDGPPREGAELPPKLTYLVHLVDPFCEALHRSERYKNALHRWQQAEIDLSNDPEYVLAKGVEYLRNGGGGACPDALAWSFDDYLLRREQESKRLLFVTYTLAADLVQWIGRGEIRESIQYQTKSGENILCDTWFGNSSTRIPSREDKGEDQWHNQYSQALQDYASPQGDLSGDSKVTHALAQIACAAVDELDQSPFGEAWLKDVVAKGIDGNVDKYAPAGFECFFLSKLAGSGEGASGEGNSKETEGGEKKEPGGEDEEGDGTANMVDVSRKANEFTKGILTSLLKKFGKHWVEHYRHDALTSLQNFYKARHGISIVEKEAGMVRSERRAVESEARRELRRARRRGVKKLELAPGALQGWTFAIEEFKLLQVGLEMVNMCYAAQEARDGDPWKVLEALGAMMDASKALYEQLAPEDLLSEVEEGASAAGRIFKVVGFASAAIDIICGVHGIYQSETLAGQVSQSMKTLGAALVIGGGFAEGHPAGVAVMAFGAGLEGVGSYWESESSEVCEFLRNCKWGSGPSWSEKVGSAVSDNVNSSWYRGKLSQLKNDISVQQGCVNQLSFNYAPEITFDPSSVCISVQMKGANKSLGPAAKWTVIVNVTKSSSENGPEAIKRTVALQPNDGFDDLDWTAGEEVTFQALTPDELSELPGAGRTWILEVEVIATVDVAGDSKRIIGRTANATFAYTSQAAAANAPQYEYGTPGPTDSTAAAAASDAGTGPVGAAGDADIE